MSKKKLSKEELTSLRKKLTEFNQAKVKLADAVLHQEQLKGFISQLKEVFVSEEQKLLDKYGKDASINLETGEVTKQEPTLKVSKDA